MRIHLEMSAPLYAEIDIISQCQLSCSYCSSFPLSGEKIRKEDIYAILDELSALSVFSVSLTGGEPTLHPDIIDIINDAATKMPIAMISTNGIRFAKIEFAKEFYNAAPSALVAISLDSTDSYTNNEYRGKGCAEAIKAIENCCDLGQPICISTVLTKGNIFEAEKIVDRFFPSVKKYRFFPQIPRSESEIIEKNDNYWKLLDQFSLRIRNRITEERDLNVVLPFKTVVIHKRGEIFNHIHSCCCPFTKIYISSQKKVYPCYYSEHHSNFLGDLNDHSISRIWRSRNAKEVRDRAVEECVCENPPFSNNVPIKYR